LFFFPFSFHISLIVHIHIRFSVSHPSSIPSLYLFLFTTSSHSSCFSLVSSRNHFSLLALGPAQPPIQWTPWDLSLGIKRPGREADHSPPSSAEVKNA
jgi:hypothetical protein